MRTECPSFSKVNIGLKILDKRNDGYHNINTIFQELEFGDYVTIDEIANGCEVISNVTWIPSNKNNICYIRTYKNHIDGLKEQIKREPKALPTLEISKKSFF